MATSSDLKLLGAWASPYTDRGKIALNLKCVDYEFIKDDIFNKSELLLKSNPVHKKIPVLLHADKPVCESLVIIKYVDQVWSSSPTILPSDPYDRAITPFWTAYIDDKNYMFAGFSIGDGASKAEEKKKKITAMEKIFEGLVLLEEAFVKCSKGKAYFGGDSIAYIDIALGSFLGWLRLVEKMANLKLFDDTKTPGLLGWAERFCSHEAVKDVIPDPGELIQYHKEFQARARAASSHMAL